MAQTGKYQEASEAFLQIQNEGYKQQLTYVCLLAKSFIQCDKPESAWDIYVEMDTSNDTLKLLNLIANECYSKNFFYFSLKAFDILERLDSENDYIQQKLGAAVGAFQEVISGKCKNENLEEIL